MRGALLGVGDIAEQYVRGLAQFPQVQLVAVADRDVERARARGAEWGVRGLAPDELFAAGDVELVVNLTPPRAHAHPEPNAYYEPGAGPLFSLGPYLVTALVQLLGRIAEALGFRSLPDVPRRVSPTIETTYAGALRFENGAIATLFVSYDVQGRRVPPIEVYRSEATLSVPDPNLFDGPVLLGRGDTWEELPVRHATGRGRGIGVADLVDALAEGCAPRASGEQALHVLDALCALQEGGRTLS